LARKQSKHILELIRKKREETCHPRTLKAIRLDLKRLEISTQEREGRLEMLHQIKIFPDQFQVLYKEESKWLKDKNKEQ
jgi:hypothetical protein